MENELLTSLINLNQSLDEMIEKLDYDKQIIKDISIKTDEQEVSTKNIETHLDNELQIFNEEFKKVAIRQKHPYVRYYLLKALEELKNTIASGKMIQAGRDELFF